MNKIDLKQITTEAINQDSKNIDLLSTREIIELINNEDKKVAYAIEKELDNIAKVIDLAANILKTSGRIIYIGAGTSGRLGILDAAEIPPTFNYASDKILALIAGGEKAFVQAIENIEDDQLQAIKDLKKVNFTNDDLLIALAASGRTPYVLSALEYANSIGASTVGISCSGNAPITKISKFKIELLVGPEIIVGSTRMKAGTAQKMVLNMISTAVMIKLGKTYQNLMVDLKPLNNKLLQRCINIIQEITEGEEGLIARKIIEADYSCKLAALMINKDLSKQQAQQLLEEKNGFLREALKENE